MFERLGYHPDPDNPGWFVRRQSREGRFLDIYGEMRATVESPNVTRVRLTPQQSHRNIIETIHGGFLLALIDHMFFVGPSLQGRERVAGGSTIDVSTQFLAQVVPDEPIDVLVETLRETYRMVFVRGTIFQRDAMTVAFSGTIKKASTAS